MRPEDAGCVMLASAREEAEKQEGAGGTKNWPICPRVPDYKRVGLKAGQMLRDVAFFV